MILVEHDLHEPFAHSTLRSMFEARKRVFVDLLKWDVPVLDDRFEVDQFDDRHATYLVVADDRGEHLGSARLLQTTRPHILGSLYPDLCTGSVPRGPDISEITRFCLGRGQGATRRRQTRDLLVSALVAHALERGIRTYTGVAELGWLQQILAFGWDCRPLGPPRQLQCGLTGALAISVNEQTPALLARNLMWTGDAELTADLAHAA